MPKRLQPFFHLSRKQESGFTLVELIVVTAILGVLMTIVIPGYFQYTEKVKITRTIADIRALEKDVYGYNAEKATNPDSLADIDRGGLKDAWGHNYQYQKINAPGDGRQDTVIGDLNTDFDLYSVGADGSSDNSVNNPLSADDIIRVNDGGEVVRAGDYF